MKVIELKQDSEDSMKIFLSREELNQIQNRLKTILNAEYRIENDTIYLQDKPILKLFLLGSESFYLNCVRDISDLVRHILVADQQNDELLKQTTELQNKISEQQEQIDLLSNKLAGVKYDLGDWILDV